MALSQKILGVEFLNANALRAYPLADGTTETDITGSIKLPRDFLVDFILPVNSGLNLDPGGFYISNVSVFGTGVTVTFSHTNNDGSTITLVGTVAISVAGHTPNATYPLSGQGVFGGMVGQVTVGVLTTVLNYGGSFNFTAAGTRILPTLIRTDIQGIKSLEVLNGAETSGLLYDDITLQAGNNVRITVQVVGGTQYIRFDALDSADLDTACGCPTGSTLSPPIRSINGIPPAVDGSFQFIAGTCLSVTPGGVTSASMTITDSCSEPCCGTPELETIQTDLNNLSLDVYGIRSLQELLESTLLEVSTIKTAIQNTGLMADTTGS